VKDQEALLMTQANKISLKWQKVHVFISSTFNDMHAERDYLVKQIFPQLQEWCEKRKLRLVDIDLRWGVTEHDALNNKNALKVCLDRIDECRPFFLCFLGQRRGWVPKVGEISQKTFDSFPELRSFAGASSITEMEILHALINPLHQGRERDTSKSAEYYERVKYAFFYLRETSYLSKMPADPPMLRQTYTNEGVEDPKERQIHEQELNRWRDVTIKNSGRPVHSYQARWDSSASAFSPELNIPLQCPSSEPLNIERWRKQWENAGVFVRGIDVEDDQIEARKAREFNRKLCSGRLTDFRCDGMALSQVILNDLKEAIAARYPDHIEVTGETDLQKEINQQEQFLFLSSEGFIKRGDDFAELDKYVEGDSNKLFVLTAPGGMGKSMLLANWIDRYSTRIEGRKDESIHFRFIGASDRSTTVYSLLRFLLHEMKEITHEFDEEIPEDPEKLREAWRKLLETIGKRGKTVIVIDALNQLESGLSDMNWLPWQLPRNIKLIVSIKRGEQAAEEFCERLKNSGQVILRTVEPFKNPDDRRKLVQAYLSQYLKDLDKQHLETLIQSPGANNPLYLKVVLSELRVFGVFANLANKIKDDFGETPVSAFQGVLKRLEDDPAYSLIESKQVVPLLFGLMAHARHGLSADELTSLFIQALKLKDTKEQREIAADTVYLFLRQVRPYLARREGRYDFYFESFKNAAEERYVAKSSEEKFPKRLSNDWHHMLAEYFVGMSTWQETSYSLKNKELIERIRAIRKVAELPFHQAWAGMGELADTLIDFSFMEAKLHALGVDSLIEDYDLVHIPGVGQKVKFSEKSLRLIQGALVLSAHVLADKEQLRSQLTGRLLSFSEPEIRSLLEKVRQCKSVVWLRPLTASLKNPGGLDWHEMAHMLYLSKQSRPKPGSWMIRNLKGHIDKVNAVSVTPDGLRVISASYDGTLKLWDMETGIEIREMIGHHTNGINAISLTPDGLRAISASNDCTLKLWDLETGAEIRTMKGHTNWVNAVSVTPDGLRAISASKDNTLKVWDMKTGAEIRTMKGHTGDVYEVFVTPDGHRAISASWDKMLKIWDLETGAEICTMKSFLSRFGVTPDGLGAISTSIEGPWDNTLKVWDIETGAFIRTMEGHTKGSMQYR